MHRVLAIDPSYTRTGICIQLGDNYQCCNVVLRDEISLPGDEGTFFTIIEGQAGHDFSTSFREAGFIIEELISKCSISEYSSFFDIIIIEYPPPRSIWSAGLYMLDSLILNSLLVYFVAQRTEIYMVPPNAINSWIGKKKLSKTEIVEFAKERIGGKVPHMTHDEASAYLLIDIVRNKVKGKPPTVFKTNAGLDPIERI